MPPIPAHYLIFEGWERGSVNIRVTNFSQLSEDQHATHHLSLIIHHYRLGNVLAVVTDRKRGKAATGVDIQWFEADVMAAQQYYPFGMLMPGNASASLRRQYTLNSYDYRYGFNGKEGDDEVKGDDNQQDYGMRIYDPRVGRFLSVDPIAREYPWYTPYQFAGNMPIWAVDLDGLEPSVANGYKTTSSGLKVLDGSAREQGPSQAIREVKHGVQQPRIRQETIDVPYQEKYEKAMRDNAVNVAKAVVVDPQALRNGDRMEWASVLLGPVGKPFKGVKALKYGDNLVEIGEQVAKHSDEAVDVGKGGTNIISSGDLLRIENAATRIGKPIYIVGSRAIPGRVLNDVNIHKGTMADWDFIIEGGLNSREWAKIKNSLPGARSIFDNTSRNFEILKGPVLPSHPNIKINPR